MNFDQLREQYSTMAGRGLWVGMFPERSEHLVPNASRIVESCGTAVVKEVVEESDLHITLAHLGRNHGLRTLESVYAAVEMAASLQTGELSVLMTGALRLRKHVAIALVPDEVIVVRHKLRTSLRDRNVRVDDSFAMVPHMTVARLKSEQGNASLPQITERPLIFRGLTLVLGDASVVVPFSG